MAQGEGGQVWGMINSLGDGLQLKCLRESQLGPGRKAAVEMEVAEVSRRRVCLPGVWRLALLTTQNGAIESRKHACLCLCLSSG